MATGFPSARRKQAESAFCAAATSWAGASGTKNCAAAGETASRSSAPYKQTVFHTRIVLFVYYQFIHHADLIAEIRVPAGKPSPAWQPHGRNRHTVDGNRACADIRHKTRPAPPPQRPRPEGTEFPAARAPRPAKVSAFHNAASFRRTDSRTSFARCPRRDTALRPERQSAEHRPRITQGCGIHPRTGNSRAVRALRLRSSAHRNSSLNSRSVFRLLFHRPSLFSVPLSVRCGRGENHAHLRYVARRYLGDFAGRIPSLSFRWSTSRCRSGRQAIARRTRSRASQLPHRPSSNVRPTRDRIVAPSSACRLRNRS